MTVKKCLWKRGHICAISMWVHALCVCVYAKVCLCVLKACVCVSVNLCVFEKHVSMRVCVLKVCVYICVFEKACECMCEKCLCKKMCVKCGWVFVCVYVCVYKIHIFTQTHKTTVLKMTFELFRWNLMYKKIFSFNFCTFVQIVSLCESYNTYHNSAITKKELRVAKYLNYKLEPLHRSRSQYYKTFCEWV